MARAKKQVEVIEAAPNISMRGNEVKSIRRVAAYCRVSSDNIEQKTSYDAQIDEYTTRIQNHPKWEFAGIMPMKPNLIQVHIPCQETAEGKHYNVTISHAAKKLVRLIFALEKSGQPYRMTA